jgi:hypothetical protein
VRAAIQQGMAHTGPHPVALLECLRHEAGQAVLQRPGARLHPGRRRRRMHLLRLHSWVSSPCETPAEQVSTTNTNCNQAQNTRHKEGDLPP